MANPPGETVNVVAKPFEQIHITNAFSIGCTCIMIWISFMLGEPFTQIHSNGFSAGFFLVILMLQIFFIIGYKNLWIHGSSSKILHLFKTICTIQFYLLSIMGKHFYDCSSGYLSITCTDLYVYYVLMSSILGITFFMFLFEMSTIDLH